MGDSFAVGYLAAANPRFDDFVGPNVDGCHIWAGARNSKGYGRFRLGGRVVFAHRFAFERTKGIIPDGIQVDHICGTPSCVHPDHLQLVTSQQNLALARIRAGKASSYGRQDARNDGLAIDVDDLPLYEADSPSSVGAQAWVPPLISGHWGLIDEGWSDPRFHN
ncbi:HNH endonuclease signature motif containing protein [Paenarthrobacter sp. NPDC089322]|uniref:HNH endonuclease signature motif containing protein n=1 Tax=Paenarthrobacter sp. NPDC089322 TaxID=3155065 RepID=UPI00342A3F4C